MEVEQSAGVSDDTNPTASSTSRLGICEVCASNVSKYTCPRCEVKTCSLKCNKIHKLEVDCNGERAKTKFIPLNKFTNLDLSSDYRLLEEISRAVEVSRKGRSLKNVFLGKRYLILQRHALAKKVTLKFLPKTFMRHKNNTSCYDFASKSLYWRVDWIFVNCENLKVSDERVAESSKICSVLSKYLEEQDNKELQEKLQYYQAAGIPGTKVLLKAEQKRGKKFYELDPSFTLDQCLRNKLIIEYPTIHVVLKDQANFYDIIDSDDEEEVQEMQKRVKSGQEVISKIIKNSENDDVIYDSLKNLLFISEYSDDEVKLEEEN